MYEPEVLALRLLAHAGSVSAAARAITIDEVDIAVIQRFDRVAEGARIPYLSRGSLLQARRDEDRAYTELADAIRRISSGERDLRTSIRWLGRIRSGSAHPQADVERGLCVAPNERG